MSGTLNGGPFTGAGALNVTGGKLAAADLALSAKNIFLEYPAGVKTTSSLDLKLRSWDGLPVLEGQVEIQEGYYDATLESFGSKGGTTRSWSQSPDATSRGIALDVGIVTKRPVEMDNNLGRVAASAKLRVNGTADRPRLTRCRSNWSPTAGFILAIALTTSSVAACVFWMPLRSRRT